MIKNFVFFNQRRNSALLLETDKSTETLFCEESVASSFQNSHGNLFLAQ